MTPRFAGRTILVVGGGADGPAATHDDLPMGNGRAIAMRLAAEGASVAVTDIDIGRAQQTVAALAGRGLAIQADAADPESSRQAVTRTENELGPIDVVVANVAVTGRQPLRVQQLADWRHTMDVNATAHWVTAQAVLQPMLDRGHGVFVFVGSIGAMSSSGTSVAYEASKAAQLAIMRHLAVRYSSRGIRSNAVVLGIIDSTMVRRLYGDGPDAVANRDGLGPMKRQGTPEEVAAAAAFLASDDASYVNGHALVVDGGLMAQLRTST